MPTSEVSPAGGAESSPTKKKKKPKKKKPEGAEGQQPQADPNAQGKQLVYCTTSLMTVDCDVEELVLSIVQTRKIFCTSSV